MRFIKIIILLLFPFIAEVVVSCCSKCPETVIGYYTNKTITLAHLDNSGSGPVITTAASVLKEAYGIRVSLLREKTACIVPVRSLFIQSAYAFKCVCRPPLEIRPRDTMVTIQIFTLNNFDNGHPANSEVSDYFKVFQPTSFNTIPDYLKSDPQVLSRDSDLEFKIDLLLMTPPAVGKGHKFEVRMTLSDGRVFEQETGVIDLI